VTFDVLAEFMREEASLPVTFLIIGAMAAILFFGVRHFWLLAWNLREFIQYRKTSAFEKLRKSNNESKLIGLPLTLAMTVNMSFAAGAAFIPGLWNVVEYLFPGAMLAFLLVGMLALSIYMNFFSRVLANPEFDCNYNNSLGQLKAILTFGLIGVGFSAPAAMSVNQTTVTMSIIGGLFFMSIAMVFGLILFVLGFRSMLAHGISKESSVSLWIPLPILTVLGVGLIRVTRGLAFLFGDASEASSIVALRSQSHPGTMLVLTTIVLGLQILFMLLGYLVMRRVNYFETYVSGPERSADSYALICPGTAMFVFGMFFIHMGLVRPGLLEKFSLPYFIMLVPLVTSQLFAIRTMMRLDRKLLRPAPTPRIDTEPEIAIAS
jgi:hypothetical protein